MPLQFAAGNRQVARLLGAAGEHHRVVFVEQSRGRDIDADIGAVVKHHALGLHLRDAAVDVVLFHLEVGNAVAQQPAGFRPSLVDVDVVTGAGKLLRAGEPGGP